MSPSPKINISAIMNKKNAKKAEEPIKVDEPAILEEPIKAVETVVLEEPIKVEEPLKIIEPIKIEEEVISKIPHISISSIKTSKSPAEKEEIIEDAIEEKHENKKEELIETLVDYIDNNEQNTTSEKIGEQKNESLEKNNKKDKNEDLEENTEKEESLEEIEAKINKKVEEETKEKFKLGDKELKSDEKEKELFGNYQSDFKEKVVIEKIKEKKKAFKERLKEPKTRITLIAGLLILLLGTVSGLFVLDPSNHSFEIYKKGILNNLNKVNINTNLINNTWVSENINVENRSFGIFTQKKLFGGIIYKYKDVVYKTKLELETVIKNELNEENAAKLAEKARLEAEKARLEAEKIRQEKKAQENAKIKNVLLNKFK